MARFHKRAISNLNYEKISFFVCKYTTYSLITL